MTDTGFYRAFEERFRGSRQLVRQRLEAYVPFLQALLQVPDSNRRALDLGCGRGEWLELTGEQGFSAHGVDMDAGMLAACHERQLSVSQGDAIEALARADDASLAVVSGFHIAEHLPFDTLTRLLDEARRALEPEGLLILETPNPENLRVAAHHFHTDPTHLKPLPPGLLGFLAEHAGFERLTILRLQEDPAIRERPTGLHDVLEGVSPDYAVVAQKAPRPVHAKRFDEAFEQAAGVNYHQLVRRFDERFNQVETRQKDQATDTKQRFEQMHERLEKTLQAVGPMRETVEQLRREYQAAQERHAAALTACEEQAEARRQELDRENRAERNRLINAVQKCEAELEAAQERHAAALAACEEQAEAQRQELIDEHAQQCAQMRAEHDQRHARLADELARARAGLERQLREAREALASEQDENRSLRESEHQLRHDLDYAQQRHERLARENDTLQREREALEATVQQQQAELSRQKEETERLQTEFDHLRGTHDAVLHSRSWRVTAPLRKLMAVLGSRARTDGVSRR